VSAGTCHRVTQSAFSQLLSAFVGPRAPLIWSGFSICHTSPGDIMGLPAARVNAKNKPSQNFQIKDGAFPKKKALVNFELQPAWHSTGHCGGVAGSTGVSQNKSLGRIPRLPPGLTRLHHEVGMTGGPLIRGRRELAVPGERVPQPANRLLVDCSRFLATLRQGGCESQPCIARRRYALRA